MSTISPLNTRPRVLWLRVRPPARPWNGPTIQLPNAPLAGGTRDDGWAEATTTMATAPSTVSASDASTVTRRWYQREPPSGSPLGAPGGGTSGRLGGTTAGSGSATVVEATSVPAARCARDENGHRDMTTGYSRSTAAVSGAGAGTLAPGTSTWSRHARRVARRRSHAFTRTNASTA